MFGYERVISSLVHACAESGQKIMQELAMAGDIQPLYLHFKRATGADNGVLLLIAKNDTATIGYELATSDALHCGVPYQGYYQWVRERCSRLPVLSHAA